MLWQYNFGKALKTLKAKAIIVLDKKGGLAGGKAILRIAYSNKKEKSIMEK